jgi:carboxypeptidase family protein
VNGQVNASKAVTIGLYDTENSLVASVAANPDGTFNLEAPAGGYTIVATASGFLSAQGTVTITGGAASTMPTINLLAGDIDNNNVIDQFDAMTIGMSYNTADPVSADLNSDGVINVLDLELLAQNYRQTGPTAWQ